MSINTTKICDDLEKNIARAPADLSDRCLFLWLELMKSRMDQDSNSIRWGRISKK